MNKKDHIQFAILTLCGMLALFAFATLWFGYSNVPNNFHGYARIGDICLFLAVSYVIWLPIFMKVLTWSVASHIKPFGMSPVPRPGMKVAFITTFVPKSESVSLLHQCLPSMVAADYPHDTWLLDEGDDPEVKKICQQYGVKHFSRFGLKHYHGIDGKFTTKTKGGNHNAWYDAVGDTYDIVATIDTDFIAHKQFLTRTLGFFNDKHVAFVGTPQIYKNMRSLIARGAAQQTYSFYGPLLRGMDGMNTTLLIGANHVIRVSALRSVGHYSAHITEDLLTGMKLHAKGWRSIYVPKVLAIGEGPSTWKAYFNQQNRWAYGCMHILFNHSFKLFSSMSLRRITYYLSIQQYYFSGVAMLLGVVSLLLYFFFGLQSINIDFMNFVCSYIAVVAILSLMDLWLQRFNIRPKHERGIMWSGMYVCMSVWPIFMLAFLRIFKRKKLVFKVTPKGGKAVKQPSQIKLFYIHFLLGGLTLAGFVSSFYTHRTSIIMLFWAVCCSLLLIVVPFIPPIAQLITRSYKIVLHPVRYVRATQQ